MMQIVVDWAKNRWHRDIVSHPVIHGWVLNLYRAGERYPQTVTDYFPVQHAPHAELAENLRRHRRDEERHTAMYAAAIRALGQPVVDADDDRDVFNAVIRSHTGQSFTISDDDSGDAKRLKLAHFLAHAHFLEKRIARSLEYHRDACERAGSHIAERAVTAVLEDERHHVAYTAEAARDLLTHRETAAVFEHHRHAEAKANLDFSQKHVRDFTRMYRALVPFDRVPFYRACALVMERAVALV